ncbi:M protein, serotype 2.1 precursor [Aspergillus ellipticus CBS 707.79]|uniref:M protein, serotype 2.1 n=1 Tax=Aspergillus ellipticus CBS 707.79 TaxID=1448320 RepID=A0A319DFG8_9EURO|nr:M protein, serotype 2.1 precursor [Aspergillus ellipticus CBS 707.79]
MSATPTPRKPGTPASSARSSTAETHAANGASSRPHSRSPSTSTSGVSRPPSLRASTPVSARAAARKPGRSNLSTSSAPKVTPSPSDEEARAQNAALIDDLKEQLQKAETASEQYRKQLGVLQMRLDEAVSEQGKLEDQSHERDSKIEALNGEIREHVRQIRDLEQAHDLERNAMLQEKEQQGSREEEMQATIQRLKESLAQKERSIADADKTSFRNRASPDVDGQFAPSSQIERSPSRNNSKLLLQKDKLIESLRLELAESQIKLVEMENKGGGRQRELEKELLEARMANARLMEDNESYQLLLSERTLNGDFTKGDFMREVHPDIAEETTESGNGLGSLADELESVDARTETDNVRKLELEVKALKDQNKALTLYIERIISRLLQHDGFETILDKNENDPPKQGARSNKELPPTPPEKDDAAQQTFLQRAKSVVGAPHSGAPRPLPHMTQPRSRPTSYMPPPTSMPTAHENPETAPSIPLRAQSIRGHRRTRSEQTDPGAGSVVGQMYRGRNSGGPISPTLIGPGSRQSAFSGASIMSSMSTNGRAPSLSSQLEHSRLSSSDSVTSDPAGDTASTGATSNSPRSSTGMTNYTGAVMTQNKLRPLRLVSETRAAEEEDAARKKANRGSWISWFNRPPPNPSEVGQSPI